MILIGVLGLVDYHGHFAPIEIIGQERTKHRAQSRAEGTLIRDQTRTEHTTEGAELRGHNTEESGTEVRLQSTEQRSRPTTAKRKGTENPTGLDWRCYL